MVNGGWWPSDGDGRNKPGLHYLTTATSTIARRGPTPNKSVGNTIVGNPTPPYGQGGRVIPRFSLSVVPSYSVR